MRKAWMHTGLIWLWISVLCLGLDRLSKAWVIQHLHPYHPHVITSLFNLTLAYNTGAAFSLLHAASGWQNWVLGGIAVIVSGVIVVWLSRLKASARWESVALCLILAGAIGNVCDRVVHGYVIDFLDFHLDGWHFAIFNVADSVICIGAAMLCLRLFVWVK
jgi:signal peptidase II